MPACERQIIAGDDVGLFVHRQPDAVPGAVHEILGEPGLGQHAAGGGVHLLGGHAGTHRVDRRPLRPLQH